MYLCNLYLLFAWYWLSGPRGKKAVILAPSMGQGQPPLTSETQRTILGVSLTPWCLYTSVAEVARTQRSGTMYLLQSFLGSWIADKCLLECVFSKYGPGSTVCQDTPGGLQMRFSGGQEEEAVICTSFCLALSCFRVSSLLLIHL